METLTCPACSGDGIRFDVPGEPHCDRCGGCGDIAADGSRLRVQSHGEPPVGGDKCFKTGDIVRLKDRESRNVGTIRQETRYVPTDGRGPVFHFSGDDLSSVAACVVRQNEIERVLPNSDLCNPLTNSADE